MDRPYFFHPFWLTLFSVLFISGCTTIPPANDGYVSTIVEERINSQTEWYQGFGPNDLIKNSIQCLLDHELSADNAIQIALLNNPQIQSFFEELGIARANLIEAGLLSNPSFEVEIRYPNRVGLKTNIEYLITSSLLDIFLIPLRIKLAATEFEQTKLKVANEILNLAFDVRQTYYELLSERQKIKYIESLVELTSINSTILEKQVLVGNVNKLELQSMQSKFLEAQLQLSQAQIEKTRFQEKLNRLLGLKENHCLKFSENFFQSIDYQDLDLCILEKIALEKRLDLQIARFEITRLSQLLGLKEWWTYTNFKGGLAGERDTDGTNVIGPGLTAELPIFNYGQAARLKLHGQLMQAYDHLATLEIEVLSELREAHKLLINYLSIINIYHDRLLPLQHDILISSEALYNVMGLGIHQLLANKMQEITINQYYIENIKKYLISRAKLDRALGGNLSLLIQDIPTESIQ